jgi:hypothetical protein
MSTWTISPTSPSGRVADVITFIAPNSELGAANQSQVAEVGTWTHLYAVGRDQGAQVMHELASWGCKALIGTPWPTSEASTEALADDRSGPSRPIPKGSRRGCPSACDIRTNSGSPVAPL